MKFRAFLGGGGGQPQLYTNVCLVAHRGTMTEICIRTRNYEAA